MGDGHCNILTFVLVIGEKKNYAQHLLLTEAFKRSFPEKK